MARLGFMQATNPDDLSAALEDLAQLNPPYAPQGGASAETLLSTAASGQAGMLPVPFAQSVGTWLQQNSTFVYIAAAAIVLLAVAAGRRR